LQLRRDEVPSTQDLARSELDRLPTVVIAERQTAGRGRTGAAWLTAPRALAASVALLMDVDDRRPLSLMAGLAAVRVVADVSLKWPNDVVTGEEKLGGILVERSGPAVVAGIGINLWWPDAPEGVGALRESDPGRELHAVIGGMWAAELLGMAEGSGWPVDEYRAACVTVGREITWEPDGRGKAVDVNEEGELIVEQGGQRRSLNSGVIRHLRSPL
jgi:BirA family biotin operon repressor/biotin-[acetyl-CoA-carboxylase] ligase